jgi:activator of 2-hydroxyglutaryl-CoA dehydratase
LFIGIAIAPKVVPLVAPEFVAIVPEAQMIAGAVGAALVGKSKWNHMKGKSDG